MRFATDAQFASTSPVVCQEIASVIRKNPVRAITYPPTLRHCLAPPIFSPHKLSTPSMQWEMMRILTTILDSGTMIVAVSSELVTEKQNVAYPSPLTKREHHGRFPT